MSLCHLEEERCITLESLLQDEMEMIWKRWDGWGVSYILGKLTRRYGI
jgi:hypothetical protein